jgi:hypothetical protein
MNAYSLKIDTSFGIVTVESDSFSYLKRIQEAVDIAIENCEKDEHEKINQVINRIFDAEVKKQPAKKRGRPAGSTNKARKAK